jgi:hypothetical protein
MDSLTGLMLPMMILVMLVGASANPPGVVDLPPVEELPVVEELPDPFTMNDGTRVATKEDWARRRKEIEAMLLYYQYGHMPPAPDNLTAEELSSKTVFGGAATEERILLKMGPEHKVTIRVGLIIPKGRGPFPVILKNDPSLGNVPIAEEIVRRGYIVAEYVRTDLDLDQNHSDRGVQSVYPDYDWATLAAWAWGAHRVVDYFMTLDCVDKDHIALTGHSRGGKTALLAGALDERITLVAPNGSGCGGAGCYRVQGKKSETLRQITDPKRFQYWFHPRFGDFAGKENRLPFDQHFLKALVAPRALICTDALGDLWANPLGTQQTTVAAQPVFDFLGASQRNGIHFRQGGHDQTEEDWRALVDFADYQFFGKTVDRKFDVPPFPDAKKPFTWTAPDSNP